MRDKLLMIILLSVSGFPIITQNKDIVLVIFALVSTILVFKQFGFAKSYNNKSFWVILLVLIYILIIQSVYYNYFRLESFLGLIFRILIAYNIFALLSKRFIPTFTKVIYFLSVVGIIVFIASRLVPQISELGFEVIEEGRGPQKSIFFYNFILSSPERLVGPFWEPGAFAGFLILAIYFNLFYIDLKIFSKQNLILGLALILTFSTMGYIALFMVIFSYLIIQNGKKTALLLLPLFLVVLLIGYQAFTKLEFLGTKIQNQAKDFVDYSLVPTKTYNSQRFISAYVDYEDFLDNWVIGTGIPDFTRYELLNHQSSIRTNGIMDLLLKFGIFGFIMIMIYYLKHFKNEYLYAQKNKLRYLSLFVLLFINLSQLFFYLPFFMVFMFSKNSFGKIVKPKYSFKMI